MKIVVDAFGGDFAPEEIIKGAASAVKSQGVNLILTGDESRIREVMKKNNIPEDGIEIVHCTQIISMDEEPVAAVRSKKDSSMVVAAKLLSEEKADAMVCAGSTGALLAAATLIVKRINGVKRPALSPLIPTKEKPFMLLDVGANAECKPEYLVQFAKMGSVYMKKMFGIESPRIGLVNIGAEEIKGTDLQISTHALLKESGLNFVGNTEPKELMTGICDVAVADGFTGNIVLKSVEGTAKMLTSLLKDMFYKNFGTKLAALILKNELAVFKKKMDAKEYGGTPLLGISKPVIKAHGSSDAVAFENAIRQAVSFTKSGMIEELTEYFAAKNENIMVDNT